MFSTTLTFAASSFFALSLAAPVRLNTPNPSALVARDSYVMYGGDGSVAAGWPAMSSWLSFDKAWEANLQVIQQSCKNNGWGDNNSDAETQAIKDSIEAESSASKIPKEFILAIMMQESKGCVRAPTTTYAFSNPGLLQSAGMASCNPSGTPVSPCPSDMIRAMIHDGTDGENLRTTLKTSLESISSTDDSRWYKTARSYNAGPNFDQTNLGKGPTNCYASDIANRLVQPFGDSPCNAQVIATLTSTQGHTSTANTNNPEKEAPSTSNTHQTASSTTTSCSKTFTPKEGDTCASAPVDFATLRKLNSQINDTCSNLMAGKSYCVGA